MSDLGEILVAQRELQARMGYDFTHMTTSERIDYIILNLFALGDELHEAAQEAKWKPWAKGAPFINRDAYLKELTDALHFLINLYMVVGASEKEITELYFAKNKVNHDRQDNGYTGREKCSVCQRAMDEPDVARS